MGQSSAKNSGSINTQVIEATDANGLVFLINENNHTAEIINSPKTTNDILVPSYIKYKYQQYKIKNINTGSFKYNNNIKTITFSEDSELSSIGSIAFSWSTLRSITIPPSVIKIGSNIFYGCNNLQSVIFSENSQIRIINKDTFLNSSVEEIYFPSSIEQFEEGWCKGIEKLTKVTISPNNRHFTIIDNSFIVGKTDPNKETFNSLIFSVRNIESAIIPEKIECIRPFSFSNCKKMNSIEFKGNSKLASIGSEAFSYSSLESICIPSSCRKIDDSAFVYCKALKSVTFSESSQIQKFSKYLFSYSSIEELYIPSSLSELEEGWCKGIEKLKKVTISPHNRHFTVIDNSFIAGKSGTLNTLIFSVRNIESAIIPEKIERIGPLTFSNCKKLNSIEFKENSRLVSIGKQAFSWSSITRICLPKSLRKISEHAFSFCTNLRAIEFSENSELELIDESAFSNTSIEAVSIPSNVLRIEESAFSSCQNLRKIELKSNSMLHSIEKYAFAESSLKNISVPSGVRHIAGLAFYNCGCFSCAEFLCSGTFNDSIIANCKNFFLASFPNSKEVSMKIFDLNTISENFSLFICAA